MKRSEINSILSFFDNVPIAKIKDKELRSKLTLFVFCLNRESKAIASYIADLNDHYTKDNKDRMAQFIEIARKFNLSKDSAEREVLKNTLDTEYAEEKKVNEQLNDAITAYLDESAETNTTFAAEAFLDAMADVDVAITGRDLRLLEAILE